MTLLSSVCSYSDVKRNKKRKKIKFFKDTVTKRFSAWWCTIASVPSHLQSINPVHPSKYPMATDSQLSLQAEELVDEGNDNNSDSLINDIDNIDNHDNHYDDELNASLASSVSATEELDLSDNQLTTPQTLIDLSSKISQFAVTSLILSNNSFVLVEEHQQYNDDKFSNRGIVALADALKIHQTITNLDLSDNNLGVKGQTGIVAIAKAIESGR